MKSVRLLAILLICSGWAYGQDAPAARSLRTDLIEATDRAYSRGEMSHLNIFRANRVAERLQIPLIASSNPTLSWQMNDSRHDITQSGYQVQLSCDDSFISVIYDSDIVSSSMMNHRVESDSIEPNHLYYWRVKLWNSRDEESSWSAAKGFFTADSLKSYASGSYPLSQFDEQPKSSHMVDPDTRFYDFGKAAFGRIKLTVDTPMLDDTLRVRFGEVLREDGRLDREPGGSRRYREVALPLMRGMHTYTVSIEKDLRNTGAAAILMPEEMGDVYPFRYCEVEGGVEPQQITRESVTYHFDDYASHFASSDTLLNAIWDFCKYSIKATSFAGIYVDGDRERIPYEADVYINQLCHYGVDSEYTLARKTQEYMLFNPTWPTEWILSSVLIAWNDYLYSGNSDFIREYYGELKHKTLSALTQENGLISSRCKELDDELHRSIHFNSGVRKRTVLSSEDKEGLELIKYGEQQIGANAHVTRTIKGDSTTVVTRVGIRDIVDWPHKGAFGMSRDYPGECDGFVFTKYNAVVNAYHNKALRVMAKMARSIGEESDAANYEARAQSHKEAFNRLFFDKKKGYYNDSVDTLHSSLHANMFALAFELVPQKYIASVTEFVKSRGMACSVYGSQHLLDAIYAGEDGAYGMELLTARGDRGWAHAIYNVGTTISLEAWDNKYKPNQDWNHAWGAAPANIIPMRLMGIAPLTPGFATFRIKPQPADLAWAEITHPTIRGDVKLTFKNGADSFTMDLTIPANSYAQVWVPCQGKKAKGVVVDGKSIEAERVRDFFVVDSLGSGEHKIELITK